MSHMREFVSLQKSFLISITTKVWGYTRWWPVLLRSVNKEYTAIIDNSIKKLQWNYRYCSARMEPTGFHPGERDGWIAGPTCPWTQPSCWSRVRLCLDFNTLNITLTWGPIVPGQMCAEVKLSSKVSSYIFPGEEFGIFSVSSEESSARKWSGCVGRSLITLPANSPLKPGLAVSEGVGNNDWKPSHGLSSIILFCHLLRFAFYFFSDLIIE